LPRLLQQGTTLSLILLVHTLSYSSIADSNFYSRQIVCVCQSNSVYKIDDNYESEATVAPGLCSAGTPFGMRMAGRGMR
jgi:hypothetical protein